MRARDFVKRNVAYHSELNPVAWSHGQLRPEVRKHLLKIAEVFEHYLEIPNFEVQDIVLTGSMANYNYTRYSDFDLHIVADYTDLQCDDFAEAFYQAKKKIWNDAHDITIRGHEVELYVEDIKRTAVSGGVYSIQENDWIKEPSYDPPVIDNTAVNLKVLDLVKRINSTIKERDHLSMKSLMDKLRKMRRSGLDTEGEFGVENLAFKILRNQGYIDQLNTAYLDQQDAELSLKEINMRAQELTEIERAEPGIYTGGKEELPFTVDTKNMRGIRPLPGGSKFGYYVEGNVIYIVDPKKPREQRERPNDIVVAKLHLERASGELSQALPNLYQIETITVDEKYRRLGLARSLYGIALTILKYTLMAGSIQTAGGRRMWQMLYSIPGVEMFGVVDDYLINDKIAQAILKGGGRVIHQAPSEEIPGETDRVYAFPIRAGRNEIVSAIRGPRVYDDEGNGVSLIAKWTSR